MDKIAKTLKNISNKVYIVEKWVLMIAVIAVPAVSYTHLDVYKRQLPIRLALP